MLNKLYTPYKSKFRITDSIVTESGVRIPTISGQVGVVDDVSQNGYRYLRNFWDTVLARPEVQALVDSRRMLGCIEHPTEDDEFMNTSYENASHVVTRAWVQDHQPFATLALLNNPHGNAIKALIDVGCNPGVSTRGLGSFIEDSISPYVDSDNYQLLGWDLVKNPNFSKLTMAPVTDSLRANPLFQQLVEMHALRDSADEHYDQSKLISDARRLIVELQGILTKLA